MVICADCPLRNRCSELIEYVAEKGEHYPLEIPARYCPLISVIDKFKYG